MMVYSSNVTVVLDTVQKSPKTMDKVTAMFNEEIKPTGFDLYV